MSELLTALAAAAAALATLCALFVSNNVTGSQKKAREGGLSIPDALLVAQQRVKSRRIFVIAPSFAACALVSRQFLFRRPQDPMLAPIVPAPGVHRQRVHA